MYQYQELAKRDFENSKTPDRTARLDAFESDITVMLSHSVLGSSERILKCDALQKHDLPGFLFPVAISVIKNNLVPYCSLFRCRQHFKL
jgi:hypothetical protein